MDVLRLKVDLMRCAHQKGGVDTLCTSKRWIGCAVRTKKVDSMRCAHQKGGFDALSASKRWI